MVPFPFTDTAQFRRRPTLVLSGADFSRKTGHSVMAMITSADKPSWPADVAISDLEGAGLPAPSVVRMRLFSLDHRLIVDGRGVLSAGDRRAVEWVLRGVLLE